MSNVYLKNMKKLKPIKIPEIRFKSSRLLSGAFMEYRKKVKGLKKVKVPTRQEMVTILDEREKAWKKYEKKIVPAMQRIVGRNFYQNIIDVYTVYGQAFSQPLVISMRWPIESFVDCLTHELIHVLITDNAQKDNRNPWVEKAYPKIKDPTVLSHILVHAVLKEIYLNVLKQPDRLARDIEKCQKWPSYKKAWEIVERDGHEKIIEGFRKSKL